jgi:hypothetical protein
MVLFEKKSALLCKLAGHHYTAKNYAGGLFMVYFISALIQRVARCSESVENGEHYIEGFVQQGLIRLL